MAWSSVGNPILINFDWQYTEPIDNGVFFRFKHLDALNNSLFAIAQVETVDDELQMSDTQVLTVVKGISDIVKLPKPGCFAERRIAIKRLPNQPTLEQEVRRIFLPGYLQYPEQNSISIINRSEWKVQIEASDYVEPAVTIDLTPINTKLDTISAKIDNLQQSGGSTGESTGGSTGTTNTKTLTYVSDGDTNDVFYYIGTSNGTQAWSHPATEGVVFSAANIHGSDYKPENLADRTDSAYHSTQDTSFTNLYVQVDLGVNRSLVLSKYSIKGHNFGYHHPRNWKIQASNDGSVWTDIDTRSGVGPNQLTWATFTLTIIPAAYRYFRFRMTGPSSSNEAYIIFAEWQLYGTYNENT